jgi:hypothetical protein
MVLGALLFPLVAGRFTEFGATRPLWNFLFRESAPAPTLEAALAMRFVPQASFDARNGPVPRAGWSGSTVTRFLHPEDRAAGVHVRAGDMVRIDDVDAERTARTVRRA